MNSRKSFDIFPVFSSSTNIPIGCHPPEYRGMVVDEVDTSEVDDKAGEVGENVDDVRSKWMAEGGSGGWIPGKL